MALTKWKIGGRHHGCGEKGLLLLDDELDRVLSLSKRENGQIAFHEECDGYYSVEMSKEDAKQALQEAIAWIDAS